MIRFPWFAAGMAAAPVFLVRCHHRQNLPPPVATRHFLPGALQENRARRRHPARFSYHGDRRSDPMSVLEDIQIEVSIVLGSAKVPIRQILNMSRGAMIPLDCGHDEPTQVFVNGKAVATGKIYVHEDVMSLEVTEVLRSGRA
jgi:flagellar motor switch protein FliN/FliY